MAPGDICNLAPGLGLAKFYEPPKMGFSRVYPGLSRRVLDKSKGVTPVHYKRDIGLRARMEG